MLYHISSLDKAFAECRRVLRTGGYMLIHQMFGTHRLERQEAERQWANFGIVPANADPKHIEAAFGGAGFRIDQCIEVTSEGENALKKRLARAAGA